MNVDIAYVAMDIILTVYLYDNAVIEFIFALAWLVTKPQIQRLPTLGPPQ